MSRLFTPMVAVLGGSLVLTLLPGCTPLAKNVGEGLSDSDGEAEGTGSMEPSDDGMSGAVSAGGDEGGDNDPGTPDWSIVAMPGYRISEVDGMPDGGAVIATQTLPVEEHRLSRLDPDGELLWEVEIGARVVTDLVARDDGQLFVGGAVENDGGFQAAVWRLDANGSIEDSEIYPLPGGTEVNSLVTALDVSAQGVALLIRHSGLDLEVPEYELVWTSLGFSPQWSWAGFGVEPHDVAVLPSAEIRTFEDPGTIRRFAGDGDYHGATATFGGRFADGRPLVGLGDAGDAPAIRALDGTATIDTSILDVWFVSHPVGDFGEDLVFASTTDQSETLVIYQFDDAGAVRRAITRPTLAEERAMIFDVAFAVDGSIYVVGSELTTGAGPQSERGFIFRLPPL